MQIIPPSAFTTMPWKNGGGVTHEVIKMEREGALVWRLSIAEVASDGPFSLFPGLSRILTVIDGAGLELKAPDRVMQALPLVPLSFSGDWPIESRRLQTDVRDVNVIYNARAVAATVAIHPDVCNLTLSPHLGKTCIALVLRGGSANGVAMPAGAAVVSTGRPIELSAMGPTLLITLQDQG